MFWLRREKNYNWSSPSWILSYIKVVSEQRIINMVSRAELNSRFDQLFVELYSRVGQISTDLQTTNENLQRTNENLEELRWASWHLWKKIRLIHRVPQPSQHIPVTHFSEYIFVRGQIFRLPYWHKQVIILVYPNFMVIIILMHMNGSNSFNWYDSMTRGVSILLRITWYRMYLVVKQKSNGETSVWGITAYGQRWNKPWITIHSI